MTPNPVRDLGFVLAAVLVAVGTALLYRDKGNVVADVTELQNQYNWDVVVFFLVLIVSAAARFLNQSIFAIFAAGMLVSLIVFRTGNLASWTMTNYCRVQEGYSATQSKHTQLCTGGGILAYAGVFLAAALAFIGAEKASVKDKQLQFGAVLSAIFTLIGVIVLWASDASTISNTVYTLTIDNTVLTILATVYTLVGVVFSGDALRGAAAFLSAFVFVSSFHDMYPAVLGTKSSDSVYAGFLFCWFAMIVNIAVSIKLFWDSNSTVHNG